MITDVAKTFLIHEGDNRILAAKPQVVSILLQVFMRIENSASTTISFQPRRINTGLERRSTDHDENKWVE